MGQEEKWQGQQLECTGTPNEGCCIAYGRGSHSHSSLIEFQDIPVGVFALEVYNTVALFLKTILKRWYP